MQLLDIVKKYAVALTSIAYILPDEVERVMEEEAHTINMSVLCNRRTYTQLCQHLVTSKEHCAIAIHCTVLDLAQG